MSREKLPYLAVIIGEAVLRASPQLSAAVFKQRKNLLVENFRVVRGNEIIGLKLKQSPEPRADPNLLPAIHQHRPRIWI